MAKGGVLDGRTRILVTHQVQFLPSADRIVVIDGGKIVAQGTYSELRGMNLESIIGLEEELQRQVSAKEDAKEAKGEKEGEKTPGLPIRKSLRSEGTLISQEMSAQGTVGFKTYRDFFVKGFGAPVLFAALATMCVNVALKVLADLASFV
eukprot:4352555-Heterocapsa_arctica.AAC.1